MKEWPENYRKLLIVIAAGFIFSYVSAQEITLHQTLGHAVDIIANHSLAEKARLKLIAVEKSRQNTFKSGNYIVGYPVIEEASSIEMEKSKKLAALLLNESHYANIRMRCKNSDMRGIRFSQKLQKIEITLGLPCNQVTIAFKNGNEVKWWGSVLGKNTMKQVLLLLQKTKTTRVRTQ